MAKNLKEHKKLKKSNQKGYRKVSNNCYICEIPKPDGTICGFEGRHYSDINMHIFFVHKHPQSTKVPAKPLYIGHNLIAKNHDSVIKQQPIPEQITLTEIPNKPNDDCKGNGVTILPIQYEKYLVGKVPDFYNRTDVKIIEVLEAHMNAEERPIPLDIVGPKGEGKTLGVAAYAALRKIPLIQYDCSENTKRIDLVGRFIFKGDETPFVLGAVPIAIEVANKMGKAILCLEEINGLSPQMQKVLNQLLDWREKMSVPEIGREFKLRKGARLLVVATRNPSDYGGVFELNEDLRSRFVELEVDAPKPATQAKIVNVCVGKYLSKEYFDSLSLLSQETRNGVKSGDLSYAISTRDLVQFVRTFKTYQTAFDKKEALERTFANVILSNYKDEEKETVKNRAESIFGSDYGYHVLYPKKAVD